MSPPKPNVPTIFASSSPVPNGNPEAEPMNLAQKISEKKNNYERGET